MDHLRICLQIVKFQLASGNYIHPYVEHLSPRLELTSIVVNATVRNVINDFAVTAKGSDPYYTTQCVIWTGSCYTTTEYTQFFI